MKKITLLLAFAVCAIASAVAGTAPGTSRFYVKDFAIQKGQTISVPIYCDNPDYRFTACQFDTKLTGGIRIVDAFWYPTDRVPHGMKDQYGYFGEEIEPNHYRAGFYNTKGLYVKGTSGALLEMEIETTEDFGKEPISVEVFDVVLSDIEDTSVGEEPPAETATVYEARPLADILTSDNNKTYYVSDNLKVVAKTNDEKYAFATDGLENWIKLELSDDVKTSLSENVSYEGLQVGGVLSSSNFNPSLKVEKLLGNEEAEAVTGEIEKINMVHSFALKANQVIAVSGYYFDDDNQTTLRAYSGNNGVRGQSLTIDNAYAPSTYVNGLPYTIKKAAVELKAPWDESNNAPARIAATDELSFQNYTIFPLVSAEVATGVEDINASKSVSNVRYYNVAGVEANVPFEGINLVVTKYTDGTTSTAKLIK